MESDEGDFKKLSAEAKNAHLPGPIYSKIRENFGVLNIAFWFSLELKISENWEKNEVKFLKFLGTKLSWGYRLWSKSGDGSWWGVGKIFISPPGGDPSQKKTLIDITTALTTETKDYATN